MRCNFIFYVRDQQASSAFYRKLLGQEPILDVPGMTEFQISAESVLGLMPERGIKRVLGNTITDPETTNGIARAEIYLTVSSPEEYISRAINAGGKLLSEVSVRNWGDRAGYIADLDGHVVAFAIKN